MADSAAKDGSTRLGVGTSIQIDMKSAGLTSDSSTQVKYFKLGDVSVPPDGIVDYAVSGYSDATSGEEVLCVALMGDNGAVKKLEKLSKSDMGLQGS